MLRYCAASRVIRRGSEASRPVQGDRLCHSQRSEESRLGQGEILRFTQDDSTAAQNDRRSAVFLDRDGTVNREVEYLHQPRELRLIRGAAQAIRRLNEARVPAILVTNQAGIGRGYYAEEEMEGVHRHLERRLAARGAHLDAIYHCPHRPDEGCECRKPQPGMLLQAAAEWGLDLSRCFAVGDKVSDLEAGKRVGCRTVLVLTGYGREMREQFHGLGWQPDHVAGSLRQAVEWILAQVLERGSKDAGVRGEGRDASLC